MGYKPREFWKLTPYELNMDLQGRNDESEEKRGGLTESDVDRLTELMERDKEKGDDG